MEAVLNMGLNGISMEKCLILLMMPINNNRNIPQLLIWGSCGTLFFCKKRHLFWDVFFLLV